MYRFLTDYSTAIKYFDLATLFHLSVTSGLTGSRGQVAYFNWNTLYIIVFLNSPINFKYIFDES